MDVLAPTPAQRFESQRGNLPGGVMDDHALLARTHT
jgi:hypothetical protein